MNAVIYARYSSVGQRDVSIDDQVREIKSFAERNGYTIIHTYADKAMTGRNDKRPQFRKMIADAEKHKFQYVLVYKHDRFARNQYDAVIYKKKLKDQGIKVIAVTEPIPDGHGAMILEAIYQAMAEEYSENLSQNVKRGMNGNALKCMANCRPPFGYRINKETRKYEIEPKDAPVVQKIFQMAIVGTKQDDILEYVKSFGMKRSKLWLYNILKNERYTGVYIYGDTRIDGGMPQIISKEDFEKVRSVMKLRQKKPQLKPYRYLFSGIIYCGYCNALMCGESASSHTGTVYRYYTCPTYKKEKKCSKKRISADLLEKSAVSALKSIIFQESVIERLANDVYEYMNTSKTETLATLRNRLVAVDKRLATMLDTAETTPRLPASFLERMCDLEKEKDELSERIQSEQFVIDASLLKVEDLKEFIRGFNTADDKALVSTFVTRITVYDDYAILEYDASGDNEIRVDFVHDDMMPHQDIVGTKFYICNARLYVRFPLAA